MMANDNQHNSQSSQPSHSSQNGYLPANDSKKATKALLKHIDITTYASIENGGFIEDIADNQKAIESLAKNKLGFMIEEMQGFQLAGSVLRYVHHTTQTSRLRASSETLAGLIDELEGKIETYHTLKRRGSQDTDYFESEIQERVIQIIDELSQATLHFSYQVHNVLNIITDLDVRIRENENALKTIDSLNAVFYHLNVEKLSTLARNDEFLQPLLLRILKSKLDQAIKELIQAGHQLRQNLTQLQQDKRWQALNHLVDDWYQHFIKNPTFLPDISLATHGESCFNLATALNITTYPDLDDPSHEAVIADFGESLAKQLVPLPSQSEQSSTDKDRTTPVDDVSHQETEQVEMSPFYQAIEQFFEALTLDDGLSRLSGVQAWQTLFAQDQPVFVVDDEPITLEDWLLGLVNHYYAYQSLFEPALQLEFEEYPVTHYSGNYKVTDVIIAHAV
ncbi:hypothetical protein [Psychrobacter sp. I-STPA6b]|uniref:hypothetical protein n=1 Tax=Psychrobacter sp. I-STPA6b TaxID=2585718 RepID=UPI001D0C63A4|nr:hypothetical protein [Psychrobacter sp. I-STPA6b]